MHPSKLYPPYTIENTIQEKRFRAQKDHTTYVYDFPDMFRKMTERLWDEHQSEETIQRPFEVLSKCLELVWIDGQMKEVDRPIGENNVSTPLFYVTVNVKECICLQCGMVAWRMVLRTPEYPDGRELIVIANDLTYLSGSFGPQEYYVFHNASRMARQLRVPRVSLI